MRSEKGQAAVEFALVLPILLMLIFGLIDFGRILYTKNALTSLSQEAARHASIYYGSEDDAVLKNYVISNAGTLDTSAITGNVITFDPTRNSGSDVEVSLTYRLYYITPLVNIIPGIDNPIYITSESTFRAE